MTEFSRPFDLFQAASKSVTEQVEATKEECEALSERFGFSHIDTLTAEITISPRKELSCFEVKGQLKSELSQPCKASLKPIKETVEADFFEVFSDGTEDSELVQEAYGESLIVDTVDDMAIDIGEIIAQNLALNVDPYPRDPDFQLPDEVKADKRTPFSDLKAKLEGEN